MRAPMRGSLAACAAALIVALPELAAACPSCAAREGPGTGTWVLLGAMITVPYAVALVAIRVIRRLSNDGEPGTPPSPGAGGERLAEERS